MQVTQSREVKTNVKHSVDFSISTDAAKLFSMLSSALYTDKEKAVCYELGANCYDANPNEPFQIVAPTTLDPVVKFRDYGPGLAEHDVYRLLTVYGASDKTSDNSKIGGYGIGAKSPAAVTDSWNVISYHNGRAMEFLVFINEHGIPSLTKIRETKTSETGLEVVIPVAPNRFSVWKDAIQTAFKYYPITPIIKNYSVSYPEIKYLISGANWKLRDGAYSNGYRATDQVYVTTHRGYVPDISKLETEFKSDESLIHILKLPLIVDFDIGELQLSLSRENIQYTKHTVSVIRKKLEHIKSEIVGKMEALLSAAKDGFEFRKQIFEIEKQVLGKGSLNDYNARRFILSVIAGRHGINNLDDDINQMKILIAKNETSYKKILFDLNPKIYNGSRSQKLSGNSTCFKSHAIVIRSEYNSNSKDENFYIRMSIRMLEKIKIVINDVRDGFARAKHSFNDKDTRFVLLIEKNVFPKEMQSYVIHASSLDKAPRKSRQSAGAKNATIIKSDVYTFRTNSMMKTDVSQYKTGTKFAYVTFTDGRNQSTIQEKNWRELRDFVSGTYEVVGIKSGNVPPKGFVSLEWAAVEMFSKMHTPEYVKKCAGEQIYSNVQNSYDSGITAFKNHSKTRTTNDSIWNKLQDEYSEIVKDKGDYTFSYYNYASIAKTLGIAPIEIDKSFVDKLTQTLYDTYTMMKYVNGRSIPAKDFKDYLELVGK